MRGNEYGTLYCVSTGPGDPELMTLKAVRITAECPVIALSVDGGGCDRGSFASGDEAALRERCAAYRIAQPVVEGIEKKRFLYLSMPMTKERALIEESHRQAAQAIADCLRKGESVAWLTLGDASVYASSLYGARLVAEAGYRTEIVSGVPSFCAAAARLGRPLAMGAEEIHIVPSSYGIEKALDYPGTKVLMKAGRTLPQLKERLEREGRTVQAVERCGMEGERVFYSAAELDGAAGYYTLVIVD